MLDLLDPPDYVLVLSLSFYLDCCIVLNLIFGYMRIVCKLNPNNPSGDYCFNSLQVEYHLCQFLPCIVPYAK